MKFCFYLVFKYYQLWCRQNCKLSVSRVAGQTYCLGGSKRVLHYHPKINRFFFFQSIFSITILFIVIFSVFFLVLITDKNLYNAHSLIVHLGNTAGIWNGICIGWRTNQYRKYFVPINPAANYRDTSRLKQTSGNKLTKKSKKLHNELDNLYMSFYSSVYIVFTWYSYSYFQHCMLFICSPDVNLCICSSGVHIICI